MIPEFLLPTTAEEEVAHLVGTVIALIRHRMNTHNHHHGVLRIKTTTALPQIVTSVRGVQSHSNSSSNSSSNGSQWTFHHQALMKAAGRKRSMNGNKRAWAKKRRRDFSTSLSSPTTTTHSSLLAQMEEATHHMGEAEGKDTDWGTSNYPEKTYIRDVFKCLF